MRLGARSALFTSAFLMRSKLLRRCWLDGWINRTQLFCFSPHSGTLSRPLSCGGLSRVCGRGIEDGQQWPWCLTVSHDAEILGTGDPEVWYADWNSHKWKEWDGKGGCVCGGEERSLEISLQGKVEQETSWPEIKNQTTGQKIEKDERTKGVLEERTPQWNQEATRVPRPEHDVWEGVQN